MADGIHPVTFSEWKLVQRRLDDLENLVQDLKLKLETLKECKCNRSNSYLENQHSDEEETETIIGLNTQSTSAATDIIDVAGQSTTKAILTFESENNKHTSTSTIKGSQISSKKCSVLQRRENGVRSAQISTPPLSHEKRFACHFCSKRFDAKCNLTQHVRVHTGDKPFLCTICFKAFTQEAHLKTHTRIHTGDKPFECGLCSKKFSHSSTLALHMRIHTAEKPYTCQFCSRGFARHCNLAVHLRVHTREKPYSCPYCPKAFAQVCNLKGHLNRKHPGRTPKRQGQIHHEEVP